MRGLVFTAIGLLAVTAKAAEIDQWIDQIDRALTFSALDNNLRARLSGTFDLEFYHFEQPAPALIDSGSDGLVNPRLTLFADVQYGHVLYFFAETRLDRGFDPSDRGASLRLDEYALRITPWSDDRFSFQAGKFATVVGNWVPRHLSWDNPFIDAPLVYENVTQISDKEAPASALDFANRVSEKYGFNPVIWGPDYTTGFSISGRIDQFDYAAELANASLSARPESWSATEIGFDHPTVSGRVGYRPSPTWTFGVSMSEGAYFRPEASATLPNGRDAGDYKELLIGQDVAFAWRHLQIWAEFYETRFEVPRVGDADTFAYYLEAKYKLTPQLFVAARWNQELFGTVGDSSGVGVQWGHDLGRIDLAVGYRFTENTQIKLQYSFQKETSGPGDENNIFAAQFTVRF